MAQYAEAPAGTDLSCCANHHHNDTYHGKPGVFFDATELGETEDFWDALEHQVAEHTALPQEYQNFTQYALRKNATTPQRTAAPRAPVVHDDGHSYGLVDTGAMKAMGGLHGLQDLGLLAGDPKVYASNASFTGIKPPAAGKALATTAYTVGLGGAQLEMELEAVAEQIPLLFPLPLLERLGAVLDLVRRRIHFLNLVRYDIPAHELPRGHLGVRLDDYGGGEGDQHAARVARCPSRRHWSPEGRVPRHHRDGGGADRERRDRDRQGHAAAPRRRPEGRREVLGGDEVQRGAVRRA